MLSIFKAIRVASGTALLLLIVGQVSEAYAQVGLAGAEFQTLQPYPHVHAVGNATVAASSSPGAIGVNPATIGESEAARVGGNFNLRRGPIYSSPWFLPETWIAAPSATVKRGDWAAGVQVKHFSRRTLDQRDPQGRRLPDLEQFEQSIKLAVAFDLSSRLTVGGRATSSVPGSNDGLAMRRSYIRHSILGCITPQRLSRGPSACVQESVSRLPTLGPLSQA